MTSFSFKPCSKWQLFKKNVIVIVIAIVNLTPKLKSSSEMKYLANMQFGPAGNRKYHNKSPSAFAGFTESHKKLNAA